MCWEVIVLCQGMSKLRHLRTVSFLYDKNLLLTGRNLDTLLHQPSNYSAANLYHEMSIY